MLVGQRAACEFPATLKHLKIRFADNCTFVCRPHHPKAIISRKFSLLYNTPRHDGSETATVTLRSHLGSSGLIRYRRATSGRGKTKRPKNNTPLWSGPLIEQRPKMAALSSLATGRPSPFVIVVLLLLQITAEAAAQQPTAIRKMGFDAGEKFFPEYYAYDDAFGSPQQIIASDNIHHNLRAAPLLPAGSRRRGDDDGASSSSSSSSGVLIKGEEALLGVNSSASIPYRAPLAAHFSSSSSHGSRSDDSLGLKVPQQDDDDDNAAAGGWFLDGLLLLAKRDYACPTGTSSCSAIGYPDSCCQAGTTCAPIADTGLGPVGCCPEGESCTGQIACADGQQGCSSASGGGCCIPGWECASVGC